MPGAVAQYQKNTSKKIKKCQFEAPTWNLVASACGSTSSPAKIRIVNMQVF